MANNGWVLNLKVSTEVYRYFVSKYPVIVFKEVHQDHENHIKFILS